MNNMPEMRSVVRCTRRQPCNSVASSTRSAKLRKRVAYLQACRKPAGRQSQTLRKDPKKNAMKRLPSYDAQTSRVEQGAFLTLSLIAAALIVTTALDSARFTRAREDSLPSQSAANTALVQIRKATGATNLTIAQPGTLGERARLDGTSRPKS
jgi:hypothetical protein